jgi:hypothetical protein
MIMKREEKIKDRQIASMAHFNNIQVDWAYDASCIFIYFAFCI